MEKLWRKNLLSITPYVAGEQPKQDNFIKLNANENPYPPSEFVQKSMLKFVDKNFAKLAVYPDPDSNELTSAIAKMLNKTGGVLANISEAKEKQPSAKNHLFIGFFPASIINLVKSFCTR